MAGSDEKHPDRPSEGTGKQFARGIDEPPEPDEDRYPKRTEEGTGKQFARGVGEDPDEDDDEDDRPAG